MAANPITYLEIAAYRALTQADLRAWEVGLIKRLDLAVLSLAAEKAPKAKPKTPTEPDEQPSLAQFLRARARPRKEG